MIAKKIPRYLVMIAVGSILLIIIYLFLLPLFKPTAYVLIVVGLVSSLLAESGRLKYAEAFNRYYIDYLVHRAQLIITTRDGKQVTLSDGADIKAYSDFERQGASQAAFVLFLLGLAYSLVGFFAAQLSGLVWWAVFVVVFGPITWNFLRLIVRPLLFADTLRQEHFKLLFGPTVADPLESQ